MEAHNFESWSNEGERHLIWHPSPELTHHTSGRTLSINRFSVHYPLHGLLMAQEAQTHDIPASGVTKNIRPPCKVSYSRAFGDRLRNFKPWSSGEEHIRTSISSSNFHTTPTGGRLNLDVFNVHTLHGRFSVALDSNSRHASYVSVTLTVRLPRPLQLWRNLSKIYI
ncbi:hypothetical protein TNCV_4289121 [Trichonephila clavipes]|nr:hypothetical protein TNCV_4289121 [Trichonephila clavipes]